MGANAQTAVPTFVASQVLTAAQMNESARTGVPVFATTTTRDAAFGGTGEKTLAEGQLCYLESTKATQYYNGTAWKNIYVPKTAFTPTWTNLTIGNGTNSWNYWIINDIVYIEGKTTLGSTSSITGVPTMTLPVNRATSQVAETGWGILGDAGTASFKAYVISTSSTNALFFSLLTSGTYASEANTSATVPFTWTTNDTITAALFYEGA